jgi:hypothetical protein
MICGGGGLDGGIVALRVRWFDGRVEGLWCLARRSGG